MTLKRKRSSQEDISPAMSSSSISRCSASPTPTRRPAHPDYAVMSMDVEGSNTNYAQRRFQPDKEEGNWLAGALNSRTRKRFRDNRPDEESMHGKTSSSRMNPCSGSSKILMLNIKATQFRNSLQLKDSIPMHRPYCHKHRLSSRHSPLNHRSQHCTPFGNYRRRLLKRGHSPNILQQRHEDPIRIRVRTATA